MRKIHLMMLWAFMLLSALVVAPSALAQEPPKAKVLFFYRSAGFEHDPVKVQADGTTIAGNALIQYGKKKNFDVVSTHDGSVFDGDINQYDAFVFYNSGHLLGPANEKSTVKGANPMTEAGFQKLLDAIKGGKGLVGIHSASDAFLGKQNENKVDLYTALIGARFVSHGPQQFGTLTITEPAQFPHLQDSGKRITTWEEWYAMKEFQPDMHVLLIQETEGMDGGKNNSYQRPPFPSSWIRQEGKGRVAYSAFGHDNRYFRNVENVRRIGELIEWSLGRFNVDVTPNFEKVTPKGNLLTN